ncbi:hypothetical protein AJ85_11205 [Alkalihalobacillus alcalophilus ATCC 27647 = CGMCC 1.3604]|uniref:Uncharacterized protein n=1 Tax=Alkalihalobacillus alcalophilus ATCC 27647 = CGMCC 1.3604 TaxID=1218173 RepID=A0A4S4K4S6_ALKAL|nr:hypothetical protein AJ85_11205 [Alkalihalobacillus alcalophilus ATCC 27647 = CGMCC 1.3604]
MKMSNKALFIAITSVVVLYGVLYWVIGDIVTR